MNIDPHGKSFLAILGTVAIGAFIGGFAGAVSAAINGDDIFAGFCSGAVAGAIISVGIAMAVVLGPVAGGALATGAGFVGGYLGDVVSQGMTKGWDKINGNHALVVGAVAALVTLGSFGIMSYIVRSTPSLFKGVTDTTLNLLSRLNTSLSLNTTTAFLAVTYGAVGSFVNSLSNLLFDDNNEIVIDLYAGCD
ncbi:MAG: hypothetical protein KKH01_04995 [Firmicutes bacterium]|nr:hypothetical protein [Bacillota bacterium]